jgi:phospholipase/carboxylesterase
LDRVEALLRALAKEGVPSSRQVLMGFSQGACLASELLWRRAPALRAFVAFTGGVIGPPDMTMPPPADPLALARLPALFATSDEDPFVPLWRVQQTAQAFEAAGARVQLLRQEGARHEIAAPHLAAARTLLTAPSRSEAA